MTALTRYLRGSVNALVAFASYEETLEHVCLGVQVQVVPPQWEWCEVWQQWMRHGKS